MVSKRVPLIPLVGAAWCIVEHGACILPDIESPRVGVHQDPNRAHSDAASVFSGLRCPPTGKRGSRTSMRSSDCDPWFNPEMQLNPDAAGDASFDFVVGPGR